MGSPCPWAKRSTPCSSRTKTSGRCNRAEHSAQAIGLVPGAGGICQDGEGECQLASIGGGTRLGSGRNDDDFSTFSLKALVELSKLEAVLAADVSPKLPYEVDYRLPPTECREGHLRAVVGMQPQVWSNWSFPRSRCRHNWSPCLVLSPPSSSAHSALNLQATPPCHACSSSEQSSTGRPAMAAPAAR